MDDPHRSGDFGNVIHVITTLDRSWQPQPALSLQPRLSPTRNKNTLQSNSSSSNTQPPSSSLHLPISTARLHTQPDSILLISSRETRSAKFTSTSKMPTDLWYVVLRPSTHSYKIGSFQRWQDAFIQQCWLGMHRKLVPYTRYVKNPSSSSPMQCTFANRGQRPASALCWESMLYIITPFFGVLGCASAIVFTCFGAAYGTAKAGVGVCATSVLRPDLIVKNIVPIVMAGIIGIYGLVVSVLIANDLRQDLPLYTGFIQLGAGLSVGLSGLAAGFAIGIVGDAGIRGTAQQSRLFVAMILILIFAEVLGLYGLIVALLMNSRANLDAVC
ncbi:V-type proton ATPase proteolipid subunit [Emergomyces africanus]|uniref:V-type proton ATPase proteolipid subunit n=1 Tax=Emergomyces africanus TaxID=1955775 RepID=A0A1B7P4U6_9EURO|nr:V-type proton ATPase proteolipid subunit [Emergomyces africanus]